MAMKEKNKKSSTRLKNEEEDMKTKFYVMIHPRLTEDYETKLKLPPAFVRKFGSTLADFATLIVAKNGDSLRVGLTTLGRDIWFDNGWSEFVGRYAIHVESFLVFCYSGYSRFSVVIFDNAATEIEYPCYDNLQADKGPTDAECKPHMGGFTSLGKESVLSHTPKTFSTVLNPNIKIEKDHILKKKRNTAKCKSMFTGETSDGFGSVSLQGSKVKREAKTYQPENPYFPILLRACDITSGSVLHVPAAFADKYLDTVSEYVKIWAPGGRKWTIELIWNLEGGLVFRNGWHQFAKGNELKEGDVCIIEFLQAEMEFKVSIFRGA